ncbi:hypothetical protein TKK_0007718 [Trichogramma kaykai]|uniref:Uncharacterized protein n=1 Tax=Trichogramma kaykai TaxID=54128 RepID=A0ABD2X842_9HYME
MLPDISKLSIHDSAEPTRRFRCKKRQQLQLCCPQLMFYVFCKKRECVEWEQLLTLCDSCLHKLTTADLVDESGNTVFHVLLGWGTRPIDDDAICLQTIKRLLQDGGPAFAQVIGLPDRLGRTPLHLAAKNKFRETMKFMLVRCRDSWQEPLGGLAANGSSALHTLLDALKEGEPSEDFHEVIELMLSQCRDLLWVGDKHGRTPLHIAAQNHQDAVASYLLQFYR